MPVRNGEHHTELIAFLEERLRALDWGINEAARQSGVSSATWSDTLNGNTVPRPATLRKMAHALGTSETVLLRLAGHMEEAPRRVSDPRLVELAQQIERLPNYTREALIRSIAAQTEAFSDVAELETLYRGLKQKAPGLLAEAEEELRHDAGDRQVLLRVVGGLARGPAAREEAAMPDEAREEAETGSAELADEIGALFTNAMAEITKEDIIGLLALHEPEVLKRLAARLAARQAERTRNGGPAHPVPPEATPPDS